MLGLYAEKGPVILPAIAILPRTELRPTIVFFWLFLTKGKNSLKTRNTPTMFVSNSSVISSGVLSKKLATQKLAHKQAQRHNLTNNSNNNMYVQKLSGFDVKGTSIVDEVVNVVMFFGNFSSCSLLNGVSGILVLCSYTLPSHLRCFPRPTELV